MKIAALAAVLAGALLVGVSPTVARAQDAMPFGAISYFNLNACPTGWQALDLANGRFVVPIPPTAGIGGQVGTALTAQQDPTHTHSFASGINLDSCEYVLIGGCCAHCVARDGTDNFSGTSDAFSTKLPYVELLACMKMSAPPTPADPIPPDTFTYFGTLSCPSGWSEAITTESRFTVGLPNGGQPGASFGGGALGALEDRQHTHTFSGSVTLSSQDIAGASGCCAHGYGKNGTYNYSGKTGAATSGLPYVQLLMCRKN